MKHRKLMVALTMIGIFLTGVGLGVGFIEYSAFEYQGEVVLGAESTEEKRLVWDVGSEEYTRLTASVSGEDVEVSVEEDSSVPENEIWFDVTYHGEYGEPILSYEEPYEYFENGTKERQSYANIWFAADTDMEIRAVMKVKDRILRELKEGKFSSYSYSRMLQVVMRVPPSRYGKIAVIEGYWQTEMRIRPKSEEDRNGQEDESEDGIAPEGMLDESEDGNAPDGMLNESEDGTVPEGTLDESEDGSAPEGTLDESGDGSAPDRTVDESENEAAPEGQANEPAAGTIQESPVINQKRTLP